MALARRYVSGEDIDWLKLHAGANQRRVSLPVYPFTRERHWRADAAGANPTPKAPMVPALQLVVEHEWTGHEWFFEQHVVEGARLLPAVMYLELARRGTGASALQDVTWQRPLTPGDGPVRVSVSVNTDVEMAASRFVIRAATGILCEGGFTSEVAPAECFDIDLIRKRCHRHLDGARFYAELGDAGFVYGEQFRGMLNSDSNGKEVLAELAPRNGEFAPMALEAALQALAAMGASISGELPLPFALGSIAWLSDATPVWAHGEVTAPDTYRLSLLDRHGNLVIALRDYCVRVTETTLVAPVWDVVLNSLDVPGAPIPNMATSLFILCDETAQAPAHSRVARYAIAWRDTAQYSWELPLDSPEAIVRLFGELDARYLPINQVVVVPGQDGLRNAQVLIAVAGSLMRSGRSVELLVDAQLNIPGQVALDAVVCTIALESSRLRPVFRLAGREQRLTMLTLENLVEPSRSPLRNGGVYVITGGAGSIGLRLAASLRSDYNAKVVLMGRRALQFDQYTYIQADVTQADQVNSAIAQILRKFGRIDGIVHAAGVTRDALLVNQNARTIAEVWNTKVTGAILLDEATRDLPLDWMMFGSSVASLYGHAGQADYAAANRFLDAFAHARETLRTAGKRSGRSVSIAWPIWQNSGMSKGLVADSVHVAMPPARALAATWRALASGSTHVAILHRRRAPPAQLSVQIPVVSVVQLVPVVSAEESTPLVDWLRQLFASELQLPLERVQLDTPFERFGLDSVLVVQINRALERRFGVLPKTLLFEYRNVREVGQYLAGATALATPPAEPVVALDPNALKAVAIIGMAGRFPDADDLDALWRNLKDGRDSIVEIPPERWPLEGFYDAQVKPGYSYAKWGGFLSGIDQFDPLFFQISPQDAESMDPQERLFLESAWHAVENAGYTPARLGVRTAVFAGVMYGEYQLLAASERAAGRFLPAYSPYWSIPNRVSYTMNFRGPSMAVDTACSSSLSAIHLACESLQRGECDSALAGAVNLNLHPQKYFGLSNGRFASSDGRCRSFGAGGDGYVPGEGVGVVVLKLLNRALADGDHIHGVIRATAVNHGGRTNGYTVPNPAVQTELIIDALNSAGVAPESISYIEAHGTGTALGDPIELAGLAGAFGIASRVRLLGSIKSNIGHLEAASGIASLAKVLLQMKHGQIAPTLHTQESNPALDLVRGGFHLPQVLTPWDEVLPRRAGISSFGAGGANAHVIVEEPPRPGRSGSSGVSIQPRLFVLSARTEERLRVSASRLADALRLSDAATADVAFTLIAGREPLVWRLALTASSLAELVERINRGEFEVAQVPWESLDAPRIAQGRSVQEQAAQWLCGATLAVPSEGRSLPLPGYPFEKKRVWAQTLAIGSAPAKATTTVARTTATRTVFTRTLTPDDAFLRDHRPQGRAVLPASAYIELVLQAAGCTRGTFRDIVWLRPLVMADQSRELSIHFDGARFEITCNDVVHCQGSFDERVSFKDRVTHARTGVEQLTHDQIYRRFDALGIQYGPSLRLLMAINVGVDQAWASLTPGSGPAFVLDAAWQAALPLSEMQVAAAPFAVAELVICGDTREATQVHLCKTSAGFDVTVTTNTGEILASVGGLAVRPLPPLLAIDILQPVWRVETVLPVQRDVGATVGIVYSVHARELAEALARRWPGARLTPCETTQTASFDGLSRIVFLGGIQAVDVTPARAEQDGVLALLHLVRRWHGPLHVVTNGVFAVCLGDRLQPWSAATIGLAKTVANELGVPVSVVDLALTFDSEAAASALILEPPGDGGMEIALRDGQRWRRHLRAVEPGVPGALPWRECGVYVIAGGAGGLGMVTARYLAQHYHARIALLGRSASQDAQVAELRLLGAEVMYCCAALENAVQVHTAFDQVRRRWGAINGVIHSAIVLADASLAQMTDERFRRALHPKSLGSIHLAEAVGSDVLDVFLFYSSANSYSANAGQSNYVAGCTFKDAYAAWLHRERGWNTCVINWGYWGDTGSVANAVVRERLERAGIHSILAVEGMQAVRAVLGSPLVQAVAIKATAEALARLHVLPDVVAHIGLASVVVPGVAALVSPNADARRTVEGFAELERYAHAAVRQVMLPTVVVPRLRQFAAALAMWQAQPPAHAPGRDEIERFYPELRPYVHLLDVCLGSYADVLTGRKEATSVLFPSGDFGLVEPIYRGNALTDYYNAIVANTAADIVRCATGPVRIVEIGAGTGGTTETVLRELAATGRQVEYLFTDISPVFLQRAKQRWQHTYPFVSYRLIDIENLDQITVDSAGGADLIIAANVLHATRDLRHSLTQAKRLLARGGVLLLNEISSLQLFATLTFGMTAGWWLFQDGTERLPHGPAADVSTWQRLLHECGYPDATVLCTETGIQAVIAASSDGQIERGRVQTVPAARSSPTSTLTVNASETVAPVEDGAPVSWLKTVVASVLKLAVEDVQAGEPLDRYGLDSLSALEIIEHIEQRAGPLAKTLLFEHNTIARLAQHLGNRLAAPAAVPVFVANAATKLPAANLSMGDDAIAIVGLAGRYPGAETLDDFAELLREGRSAIGPIPSSRWNASAHYDPCPGTPGHSYNQTGAFLNDIRGFDAALFHLSPREARLIDPQERLFLETVWHCLEDAGQSAATLNARGEVGVFVGVMYAAYQWNATDAWVSGARDATTATMAATAGSAHWSVANRASFFFGFQGPSLAVNSACSSSLSAIHLACQAIRSGDCRTAIAGGVNLITHPLHDIQLSEMQMLSRTGVCSPFGQNADGFVAGEGVGAVLLRRLDDALRDGDRIHGVIRGTAINASGRTAGYTVPDPAAQSAVVVKAMQRAGVSPHDISYIEAHGTGTRLGDPIEIRGLQKAFASERRGYCAIGSVKFNVGHGESAAGMAALTKVLLQMRHRTLYAGVAPHELNAHIDFENSPFSVMRAAVPWEASRRIAGISSFGAGGANAHVILQELVAVPASAVDTAPQLIVVTGKTPEALRKVLDRLASHLTDKAVLADVAFTLQTGREALEYRWATVVSTVAELKERIWHGGAVSEGRARREASMATTNELHELAPQWCAGAEVDWVQLHRQPRCRVALPLYPFDRKPYWLEDGVSSNNNNSAPNAAARYYDQTVDTPATMFKEEYLSLAPFQQIEPRFSWTEAFFAPDQNPAGRELMLKAQRELRRQLFSSVDFAKAQRVLDFGCGLGTDLIVLAQRYPHLELVGFTVSAEQARLGASRAVSAGVGERVKIYNCDSSIDSFPGRFDLVFGIEVAHHIENKDGLLRNIIDHLTPTGRLVMADCVSSYTTVNSPETGSYTLDPDHYAQLCARHHLAIDRCLDLTAQVANFLVDPRLEQTLALTGSELVTNVHRAWDNFGKALRTGSMRYVLIEAKPLPESPERVLVGGNLRALSASTPLSASSTSSAADRPRSMARSETAVSVEAIVRQQAANILEAVAVELDLDASFSELGVDSLSGLRLMDVLNQHFNLTMTADVIYDHSTIRELARHIASHALVTLIEPVASTSPIAAAVSPTRQVAVVGMSVRFAGVNTADALWDLLRKGTDAISEVPATRWDSATWWSNDAQRSDRTYGKWGGFLDDHDCFDPLFFRISPREAELMDPQHRIFLEECWKAIEDAGFSPSTMEGSRCGVYAGVLGNEYEGLIAASGSAPDAYQLLGNAPSILAARIAYLLDLRGPALSIDTACSSSLVAVDLACKAIAHGEIDMALAGGVTLLLTEKPFLLMSRAGMLSPRGVCSAFDAEADGIVPGEGAGVVVLKALDQALADGDHIYGVILASGVNQDGRTNGITAPSAASQAELLKEVLHVGQIDPASIGMVEAHGTGTSLGDPIEAASLTQVFGGLPAASCALGSIKSTIGHTAAAAGIAGLAKLLLCLDRREIPPSAHFEYPNPRIRLENTPFYVPTTTMSWSATAAHPRRAVLSAFGFSGTNANVVVEEAPAIARSASSFQRSWLICLSARTPEALDAMRHNLITTLRRRPTLRMGDISFTLAAGRRHFERRVAFVAASVDALLAMLAGVATLPAPLQEAHRLYMDGSEPDIKALFAGEDVRRISLPAYPFSRDRYWCVPQPIERAPRFFVPYPVTASGTALPPGPIVVFGDDPTATLHVIPGWRYAWRGESTLCLRPLVKDDYVRLLNDLDSRGIVPSRFCWHWSDGDAPHDSTELAQRGPVALLLFAQAMSELTGATLPQVVIRARTAVPVFAALGALVPSLREADPRLVFSVDLIDAEGRSQIRRVKEIVALPGEIRFPRNGVLVITGGMGGIGLALARHFSRQFGARLALLGRRSANPALLDELTRLGAELEYIQVDVSRELALGNALEQIRARFGRIDGVIHAAGMMGTDTLVTSTVTSIQDVLAAKVDGTMLLDQFTRVDDLQLFLLFSSLASTVGDFGHGDYAYANRFQSEYAQRSSGRIVAIEWPLLASGGISFPAHGLALFEQASGARALSLAGLVQSMGAVLATGAPVVMVVNGDPHLLHDYLLESDVKKALPVVTPPALTPPVITTQQVPVADVIREEIARLLRLDATLIRPQLSFHDYGFDSITLKALAIRLTDRLGVAVTPAVFFAQSTLMALAEHLSLRIATVAVAPKTDASLASPVLPDGTIAIIGMAAVLPGSDTLEAFWHHLNEGDDLVRAIPAERMRLTGRLPDAGFIDGVDYFDAEFFQIAPREAALMDPQQRLFLQCAWSALEDAAVAPLACGGTRTGVFVGVQASDYASLIDVDEAQAVTGTAHAVIANRVSFLLDLRGPSEAIDTACSSALVAVHRAVQSLLSGECELAIAGGVNLLLASNTGNAVSAMGVLAPDHRCKVFAHNADGYVRGEGVGVVVLKSLARALADGDPIRAVILGTGVAHGGRSSSLTAPDSEAQAMLLADVWSRAGLSPESITYIEAHGTGTELGDPVEVEGMAAAFRELSRRQARTLPSEPFCGIGSLKSNIGHLEPASGIASLMKVVLAMQHRVLPKSLHCETLNPHLRLDGSALEVVRERRSWEVNAGRPELIAGVSSFGFGGVNAHVVLREAPYRLPAEATDVMQLVPVSARSLAALGRSVEMLLNVKAPLALIAATLQGGRESFEYRLAVTARSIEALHQALQDWRSGHSNPQLFTGIAPTRSFRELAKRKLVAVKGDLPWLAQRWTAGELSSFQASGPRMHLPTTAFAADSHWHGRPAPKKKLELSPDDWHLRDHLLGDCPTLSAAAQLAIIHASAHGQRLSSIEWRQALQVERHISVEVKLVGERFELRSEAGVHAVGCFAPRPAAVRRREPGPLAQQLDAKAFYQQCAAAGIGYGSHYQVLDSIRFSATEAIGMIRPRPDCEWEAHPAILDAAFQTAAVLMQTDGAVRVPFALESMDVFANLDTATHTHVYPGANGFDMTILDAGNTVLAELRGFQPAAIKPVAAAAQLHYYEPVWQTMQAVPAVSGQASGGRTLIVRQMAEAGLGAQIQRLVKGECIEAVLGRRFRVISAGLHEIGSTADCVKLGAFDTVHYLCSFGALETDLEAAISSELLPFFELMRSGIVTRAVRVIVPAIGSCVLGAFASVCRSLAVEIPTLSFCTIEVADAEATDAGARIVNEPIANDHHVAHDSNGERRVCTVRESALTPVRPAPLRNGGVYLIVGGAGGLGATFARHLAQHWKAKLILTGRRPADKQIKDLLGELAALGGQAIYRAVDAVDGSAMRELVEEVTSLWSGLNGLIHSAIVLANGPVQAMSDANITAVLQPKAQGTHEVLEAVAGQPLDFVAVFSSAISFSGGAGQSNYAAACGIQDALAARWRTTLACPVVTVHWGYWGEVGIVASTQARQQALRRGVASIAPHEGIAAFERILAAGVSVAMPIKLVALLTGPDVRSIAQTAPVAQSMPTASRADDRLPFLRRIVAEVLQLDAAQVHSNQAHETLGIDSVVMMQITARLEQDLGALSKTLFFETRTLAELALKLPHELPHKLLQTAGSRQVQASVGVDEGKDKCEGKDAIAIIGMSGRFPGAPNSDALWEKLRDGVDCISEVTRWDHDAYFDAAGARDKTYSRWGGFIEDVDRFDSQFFGISPREANAMDPQERLFLETVWATLEDAGHTRASLAGSNVGVFVGVMNGNYQLLSGDQWDGGQPAGANSPYWSIANRVSFLMDFHGPSLAVDTACSSALSAIHLACESIRRGECQLAVAGAVSLLLHPRQYVVLSQMKMLSPGRHCHAFGADADGLVVGEGVGAVLLRPLADALRDGDRVLGVIRATSMNSGGRTSGYAVPNPNAQADLVADAISRSGIPVETISYLEAHGTGTALGDPIEVSGLTQAFRRFTSERGFCALGSVKSNVGHLEAAAGMVSLHKVLLQLREQTIAPTLHCVPSNPKVALDGSPFYLATQAQPWRTVGETRRAGISSFGAGGTNVHLIIEEHVDTRARTAQGTTDIVPLSARTPERLEKLVAELAHCIERHPELNLADIAVTLQNGREAMAARTVFVAESTVSLLVLLQGGTSSSTNAEAALLAGAWCRGDAVDWTQWRAARGGQRIALPSYPFEQTRHWIAAPPRAALRRQVMQFSGDEWFFTDHLVHGQRVLPGSAQLAQVLAVAPGALADIVWLAPVIAGAQGVTIEITVAADGAFELRADGDVCSRGRSSDSRLASQMLDLGGIRGRCTRRLIHADIYAASRAAGIVYGTQLRKLQTLFTGPGEVLAELDSGGNFTAIVDAALQSLMGLVTDAPVGAPRLPYAIAKLVGATDLVNAAWIHLRGGDIAIADNAGQVLLQLRGVELRASRQQAVSVTASVVSKAVVTIDDEQAFQALECYAVERLRTVLQSMGWSPGASFERLGIEPRHQRLMAALEAILGRSEASAVDELQSPALVAHRTLLERCLQAYPAILRGSALPGTAFFPEGSTDLLERVYRGSPRADEFHGALAAEVCAHLQRDGATHLSTVRVLEIGAGTGGASAQLLDRLDRLNALGMPVEYVYTDVSPAFLAHGQRSFGNRFPFVRFALLDIERAPQSQGFDGASFDVVLAANCLHATRQMARTISHASSLLVPNGLLLVNEMTAPSDFATITFGLLEGWWMAEDPEVRLPQSPLLSTAQWLQLFETQGLATRLVYGGTAQTVLGAQAASAVPIDADAVPEQADIPASLGMSLEAVTEIVIQAIAGVFEMSVAQVRDGGVMSFSDFGADSILSAELVQRINDMLHLGLKTTVIFNYPTLSQLAGHLHQLMDEGRALTRPSAVIGAITGTVTAAEPGLATGKTDDESLLRMLQELESGAVDYDTALLAVNHHPSWN